MSWRTRWIWPIWMLLWTTTGVAFSSPAESNRQICTLPGSLPVALCKEVETRK
jgi:hypothetical protein